MTSLNELYERAAQLVADGKVGNCNFFKVAAERWSNKDFLIFSIAFFDVNEKGNTLLAFHEDVEELFGMIERKAKEASPNRNKFRDIKIS